jgi:tetratricopeptide (TPR) repeat protein
VIAHEDIAQALEAAEVLARQGRWQEVKIRLLPLRPEIGAMPWALYVLASAYSRLHDPVPAREAAQQALVRFREIGDRTGEMRASNLLGIISFETGDLPGAETCFTDALQLAEALGERLLRAQLENNLGNVCNLSGRPELTRERFDRALALYAELGERLGEAQTLHNLGITHRDLGRLKDAVDFFHRAATAAQIAGDSRLLAMSTVALAELELEQGEVDAAERMARMALMRFDVHSSLFGLAEVHRVLGVIAHRRGNYDAARGSFCRALELCKLHAGPLIEAETRLEYGRLLRQLGEIDHARIELQKALNAFEQLQATRQASRARELLEQDAPTAKPT